MENDTQPAARDLVKQVRAGSRSAFDRLVMPHIPQLLRLAHRMLGSASEAEDAVQSALASVWVARAKLDPERPAVAFLTTVTLNKCRDALRRRKAARFFGLAGNDFGLDLAADQPDAEVVAADRQALERVHQAIECLPVRLREALVLVTMEGMTQREAAEVLGVTEKAVETRVYRARARLRKKFEGF